MNSLVQFQAVADQVTFVNLDILCWTGSKTLQPEDLGLKRAALPPEKLVHLGSKQLIDPDELSLFTSTRAAARRECLAVGTRFLGGFIVPDPKVAPLLATLADLEQKFKAEKTAFLRRFDTVVEAWVQENPAWATLIRGSQLSTETVAGRLAFAVQAVKLAAPSTAVQHSGLEDATQGLAGTLFQEVALMAKESLKDSFLGRETVTQRALRPLGAIYRKLDGLSFLDRRVRPVCRDIERTLAALPRQGAVAGRDLQAVIGLLAILEEPARLRAHGDHLLQGRARGSDLELDDDPLKPAQGEPLECAQGKTAEAAEAEEVLPPTPAGEPVPATPQASKAPVGWF